MNSAEVLVIDDELQMRRLLEITLQSKFPDIGIETQISSLFKFFFIKDRSISNRMMIIDHFVIHLMNLFKKHYSSGVNGCYAQIISHVLL